MDLNTKNTKNDYKIKIKDNNIGVSDREIINIIKEEKEFPKTFSKRIKLSVLIKFYQKLWNHDFTDEESDTDEKEDF